MIKIGNYFSLGDVIGRGSFGKVYLGMDKKTRESVAIKELDLELLAKQNPKLMLHLQNEISIMKEMKHQNIVCLLECKTMRRLVYLVLEYCGMGDLQSYLHKQPLRKLSEEKTLNFMKQFAEGLKVLRSKDIIHRDLKPENLLLCEGPSKDEIILKIADFGFARHIDSNKLAETLCGSPLHMAPEILANQSYTVKSDLWSVGTIMYQMLFGMPIFQCVNFAQLYHAAKFQPIVIPNTISPLAHNLLTSLLQRDQNLRISWDDFFHHPYFSSSSLPSVISPPLLPSLLPSHPLPLLNSENRSILREKGEDNGEDKGEDKGEDDIQLPSPVDSFDSLPSHSFSNSSLNSSDLSHVSDSEIPRNDERNEVGNEKKEEKGVEGVDERLQNGREGNGIDEIISKMSAGDEVSISKVLDDFVIVQRYSEIDEIMQKVDEIKDSLVQCKSLQILAEDYKANRDLGVALLLYYKSLHILQTSWDVAKEIVHFVDKNDPLFSFLHQTISAIQKLYHTNLLSTELLCSMNVFPVGIVEKIIYDSAVRYSLRGFKEETQNKNFGLALECYKFSLSLLLILKFDVANKQKIDLFVNSINSRVNFLQIKN